MFSELPFQPEVLPYALEAGSPNTVGLAGLCEGVRFLLQYEVERIGAQERALTGRLLDGLHAQDALVVQGPQDTMDRVAVVSITVQDHPPEQVAAFLDREYGIAVRSGLHCAPGAHHTVGTFPSGTVRISPGYFTTPTEIDRCLAALREAVSHDMSTTPLISVIDGT